MKQAIVGFAVGFHVGKSGQPDKRPLHGINDLSVICRKCRVSPTEEMSGDFGLLSARRLT